MRRMRLTLPIALLPLVGCALPPPQEARPPADPPAVAALPSLPLPSGPISCVPYARQVSGIQIFGDAWTWWDGAAGRYARGQTPRPGAALVMRRTRSMIHGHVAVVTAVLGSREILVTHANWGNGDGVRGEVTTDVRVIDASPLNDWTAVRVWHPSSGAFGGVYSAYGFVYPAAGNV
jgi:hypothetical protein